MGNVFEHSKKGINGCFNNPRIYTWLVLGAVTFSVYFPALSNEFLMRWDDQWVVINNYTYHGFTADNLWRILTEFYHGQYAPLNQLYYTALYAVFGLNPFVFHLGSLLLHFVNVMLVYCLFRYVLSLSGVFDRLVGDRLALFTALLFAIHPFNVESVAWLSASKILVYAFFFLLASIAYVRYISSKKKKYYFLSLLLFVLSFGGKEQAVTLSLSVVLFDYVLVRNLRDWKVWFEKAPFFILAVLGGIVTVYSQGKGYIEGSGYPFYQRLVFSSYTLTEYFAKCVIPVKLSYIYPFPILKGEALPVNFWVYPGIVITLLAAFVYNVNLRRHKLMYFALLFFIVNLLVCLHIFSLPRFAIVADRYVYISSTAVFLSIGMLLQYLSKQYLKYKRVLMSGLAVYILLLGIYSHERTRVWHDIDSLKKELREQVQEREDYLKRFTK